MPEELNEYLRSKFDRWECPFCSRVTHMPDDLGGIDDQSPYRRWRRRQRTRGTKVFRMRIPTTATTTKAVPMPVNEYALAMGIGVLFVALAWIVR